MPLMTDQATHRKRRAALHARKADRPNLLAALDRAREESQMARDLVARFDRPKGYAKAFGLVERACETAVQELDSVIPQELLNSCQDSDLRQEFEELLESRRQSIRETQAARDAFKREDGNLESVIGVISEQRGVPARLQAGSELPWSTSLLGRVIGSFVGTDSTTWAIDSENNIAFHPTVNAANVAHYTRLWQDAVRDVRLSKRSLNDVVRRLEEVEEKFADCKRRMIASPI